MITLPSEIIAVHLHDVPARRKRCRVVRYQSRFIVEPPAPVASLSSLEFSPDTLVTFDCPLGFARVYAQASGMRSFREALKGFGKGRFARFYEPAEIAEQISVTRPFYPALARNVAQQRMRDTLGDSATALRQCESLAKASPLFWLVGQQQRGRVALQTWRDVIAPRIDSIALWPFDGPLDELVSSGSPVVAEVHPGALLQAFGLSIVGEVNQRTRAALGLKIFERAQDIDLQAVRRVLLDGAGASPQGEDDFEAVVMAIAVTQLLLQNRVPEPPERVVLTEGWMLGVPPPAEP